MTNDVKRIRWWIKFIALFSLFFSILHIVAYALVVASIIDIPLSTYDHIMTYLIIVCGLIVFIGFWKIASWGWIFAAFTIPLSWLVELCARVFVLGFEPGDGVYYSIFMIIDGVIMRFIFKREVKELFGIHSQDVWLLSVTQYPLIIVGVFLLVNTFFGGIVALVMSLLLVIESVKKVKREGL